MQCLPIGGDIMNAGSLDRKISFLSYKEIENEVGATEQQLVELFKTWGRIEPIRGREYYEAQKLKESQLFKITIRYRVNVDESMIIQYQNQLYQIQHITDPYMAHEVLELHCIIKSRGTENV